MVVNLKLLRTQLLLLLLLLVLLLLLLLLLLILLLLLELLLLLLLLLCLLLLLLLLKSHLQRCRGRILLSCGAASCRWVASGSGDGVLRVDHGRDEQVIGAPPAIDLDGAGGSSSSC
jgi:hypothetical protein